MFDRMTVTEAFCKALDEHDLRALYARARRASDDESDLFETLFRAARRELDRRDIPREV